MKTSGAAQARGKAATRPVVAMGLSRASRRTAETSGGAMTIAAAVGARRAASTTHGGNNSHMNTLRNGTKSRRGCSLKASEKNTHEYVQPQLSEVEETVIIENEEEGEVTSRIVFRTGGLVDVFEVEDLTEKAGWPRRPPMKVKVALENSFMVASLYRQCISPGDGAVKEEKLIGITRVTSDTVFNATLWDVTVDPEYQGEGLGKTLMEMTIRKLLKLDIRTISLFAEPQVIDFYRKLGFWRDPQGIRAMFWYPRY